MTDSLDSLRKAIVDFRERRDWRQFHTPKDLSISIMIEAAELLENFQWKTPGEVEALASLDEFRAQVADEVADVAIYLIGLCDVMGIDMEQAIIEKLQRNETRYPVETSRGVARRTTHQGTLKKTAASKLTGSE